MNIHEYQAKELFKKYAIPTPKGFVIRDVQELEALDLDYEHSAYVFKIQIHAGARKKSGGVRKITSKIKAVEFCNEFLHKKIITPQTDADGKFVNTIYIEETIDILHEYYLNIMTNRDAECNCIMAYPSGGVEIQEILKSSNKELITSFIDPLLRFKNFYAKDIVYALNLNKKEAFRLADLLEKLYRLFIDIDAQLIEINPLAYTPSGDFLALDAKVTIDDNALFRQESLAQTFDYTQLPKTEVKANKNNLNYVKLKGSIGCIVNGAGLAMATMDAIGSMGLSCANFLDIKGSATKESIIKALEIILDESDIKCIFLNILGGIVKCDFISQAIVEFKRQNPVNIPLVLRLEGTNKLEAIKIIKEANISNIYVVQNMNEGLEKLTEILK